MRIKIIIAFLISLIFIIAALIVHQSSIDLDKTEDLKELNSISDLFMVH